MTGWQFLIETLRELLAVGLACVGIVCLRLAWMFWRFRPTREDEERWARQRRDAMFVKWLRGNYLKKL